MIKCVIFVIFVSRLLKKPLFLSCDVFEMNITNRLSLSVKID